MPKRKHLGGGTRCDHSHSARLLWVTGRPRPITNATRRTGQLFFVLVRNDFILRERLANFFVKFGRLNGHDLAPSAKVVIGKKFFAKKVAENNCNVCCSGGDHVCVENYDVVAFSGSRRSPNAEKSGTCGARRSPPTSKSVCVNTP